MKEKILIIVGPTASGKTALSLALAKHFDGEVISADSRQVYRGLDIGTEKINSEEMDGVPHHLIDIVDPSIVYSAADFKRDAENAIADIRGRDNLPIIAGGTFFYIDALLGATSLPAVPPDSALRSELEAQTPDALFADLLRLDPVRAETIDRHNKRRLIRALEVVKALGAVPAQQPDAHAYDALWIGLSVPKEELRIRIRARAKRAVERGLVEETRSLLAKGLAKERLGEIGLEYALVASFLEGTLEESELLQKLEEKNWQYAKRQMMWLKRKEDIKWFETGVLEEVKELVAEFVKR